jgi:hypothetical protein
MSNPLKFQPSGLWQTLVAVGEFEPNEDFNFFVDVSESGSSVTRLACE